MSDSKGGGTAMTRENGQEERRIWGKYSELLNEEEKTVLKTALPQNALPVSERSRLDIVPVYADVFALLSIPVGDKGLFILRDRNKSNMNTLVTMIYSFMVIFVGSAFKIKSAKESFFKSFYMHPVWFPYIFCMLLILRLILWRFIVFKMKGLRCLKTSILLSIIFLTHIFVSAYSSFWIRNIACIGATYSVFWAFHEVLRSEKHIMPLLYQNFYVEDVFLIIILMALSSEILFLFPWNKGIFIRFTSYFFLFLIFLFVLKIQIPHNEIWNRNLKDNSLFAPRNWIFNCFILFLLESAWAGREVLYGTGFEFVVLSRIAVFILLFLLILRKTSYKMSSPKF